MEIARSTTLREIAEEPRTDAAFCRQQPLVACASRISKSFGLFRRERQLPILA